MNTKRSDPAGPAGDEQPPEQSRALLGIGAAAARAGVSERALRYSQQIGLIIPCARIPGGTRRYSEDDLAQVARIRQLQDLLGFNLDEIAVILRSEDRRRRSSGVTTMSKRVMPSGGNWSARACGCSMSCGRPWRQSGRPSRASSPT